MPRILRKSDLCRIVGLSTSTIYRMEREGHFPRRIRIGKNAVGWHAHEVEAWMEARPAVTTPVAAPVLTD